MANWKMAKIGDFMFERQGRYKPDMSEISGLCRIGKIDFSGNFHIANKPSKTDMILIKRGDLVISGINVAKGALGVYDGDEDVTATIHYSSYTFDEDKISVEYFKRFLKSPLFIQLLKEQVKGGIKTEIKPKHLLPLEIPLPSKVEQLSILNRFQRIEKEDIELKFELTHQQILLKKLRQQIFQEAIEGKLTADWRAKNPDIEPASALLKRIAAEKAQLIKDRKIKAQKPLPPISDEEKPFKLPPGWEWCRLGDIAISYEAGKSFKCTDREVSGNEWGVIKTSAVTSAVFVESENKFYQESAPKDESKKIAVGDLVFCRASGSKGLAGKCCIVNNIIKNLLLSDKTPRLRLSSLVKNKFIFFHNETEHTGKYYSSLNTEKSTSMNNITKDQLFCKPVPLPSLSEQCTIATKIEKLLTLCDQLQIQINQNQSHAEQLMQAVLKEAFSNNSASTVAASQSEAISA